MKRWGKGGKDEKKSWFCVSLWFRSRRSRKAKHLRLLFKVLRLFPSDPVSIPVNPIKRQHPIRKTRYRYLNISLAKYEIDLEWLMLMVPLNRDRALGLGLLSKPLAPPGLSAVAARRQGIRIRRARAARPWRSVSRRRSLSAITEAKAALPAPLEAARHAS